MTFFKKLDFLRRFNLYKIRKNSDGFASYAYTKRPATFVAGLFKPFEKSRFKD